MRALVIGAGHMGSIHRRVLRDLGYDVITVDPDPATGADCRIVPHKDFDVVCVACPIEHLAEEAARWDGFHGHLLIEKPGAPTLNDAIHLRDILLGQRVAVGYVERFNPRVRRLRELLAVRQGVSSVRFIRWNDRPSFDVVGDLTSHDIDLRRYLKIPTALASFDSRASQPVKRREIIVTAGERLLHVDLMAHDASPLHAMWHAFLAGRPALGYATLEDAVAVLAEVENGALRAAA